MPLSLACTSDIVRTPSLEVVTLGSLGSRTWLSLDQVTVAFGTPKLMIGVMLKLLLVTLIKRWWNVTVGGTVQRLNFADSGIFKAGIMSS